MYSAVLTLTLVGLAASLGPYFAPDNNKVYNLNHPFKVGESVHGFGTFNSKLGSGASKFGINFFPASGSNIILHVDFRSSRNVLVLNDRTGMKWNVEVRTDRKGSKVHIRDLFKDGKFEVEVRQHANDFEIKLNGKTLERFPKTGRLGGQITRIQAYNGPSLAKWNILKIPAPVALTASLGKFASYASSFSGDVNRVKLDRSLRVGDEIHATGYYGHKGLRLRIALGVPGSSWNYKLNVAIRTDILNTIKKVYINYRYKNVWNSNQRYANTFPFTEGKIFKLTIRLEAAQFKILVDGKALDYALPYSANGYKLTDITVIELTTQPGDSHKWLTLQTPKKVACGAGKFASNYACHSCPANSFCTGVAGAVAAKCPAGSKSAAGAAACHKSGSCTCDKIPASAKTITCATQCKCKFV